MPRLDSSIHLDMLGDFKKSNSIRSRISRLLHRGPLDKKVYGLEWGDPEYVEPLTYIRDTYLRPFVNPQHTALEIGPGGGRWTRYLLPFKKVFVIDYHDQLLQELRKSFREPNLVFIKNNGMDFPGVPRQSVDFIFTFGTLVHLDLPLIEGYLDSMREALRPGGNAIVQYSDKTKVMAQENPNFSDNDPDRMRQIVRQRGFEIVREDVTTLWHSSLMHLTI